MALDLSWVKDGEWADAETLNRPLKELAEKVQTDGALLTTGDIATVAEVNAGTLNDKLVTPWGLSDVLQNIKKAGEIDLTGFYRITNSMAGPLTWEIKNGTMYWISSPTSIAATDRPANLPEAPLIFTAYAWGKSYMQMLTSAGGGTWIRQNDTTSTAIMPKWLPWVTYTDSFVNELQDSVITAPTSKFFKETIDNLKLNSKKIANIKFDAVEDVGTIIYYYEVKYDDESSDTGFYSIPKAKDGAKGDKGESSTFKGNVADASKLPAQNTNGDYYFIENTLQIATWQYGSWMYTSVAALKGEKGADGATGKQGADGKQGPQGLPGKDGTNGTNGTNGAAGVGISSITVTTKQVS